MNLRAALVRALADLSVLGVPHALIGGLAVSARTEPRMTRDVDLAIAAADDSIAEDVLFRLGGLGYSVDSVLELSAVGRLSTARVLPPGKDSGMVLDLLFASSGIETELVNAAEPLRVLSGVTAPVARIGHLIALKLLSEGKHRPNDAADLVRLIRGVARVPTPYVSGALKRTALQYPLSYPNHRRVRCSWRP